MTDLLAVIADTMQFREIRAWLQEANDELRASPDDKAMKALAATCAYLIRDDEMVARAYGQYIAWRSGDAALLSQIDADPEDREAFARAYAQWIAVRSGSAAMRGELDLILGGRAGSPLQYWGHDDSCRWPPPSIDCSRHGDGQ